MDLVSIINGPNLNLLGEREPEKFGRMTLDEIEKACDEEAARLGFATDFRQSNHEGHIIDWLQEARKKAVAIILNPAGLSTTSASIAEALKVFSGPIIEVHLSNVHRQEDFRSKVSPIAQAVITGLGPDGYLIALNAVHRILRR